MMKRMSLVPRKLILIVGVFLIPIIVLGVVLLRPSEDAGAGRAKATLNGVLLDSSDRSLRAESARALGKIGDRSYVGGLLLAYQKDDLILDNVVQALADLGMAPTEMRHDYVVVPYSEPSVLDQVREWVLQYDLRTWMVQTGILLFLFEDLFLLLHWGAIDLVPRMRAGTISTRLMMKGVADRLRIGASLYLVLLLASFVIYEIFALWPAPQVKPNPQLAETVIIDLVGRTRDSKAVPWLIEILKEPNHSEDAKWRAAQSLGIIAASSALDALTDTVRFSPSSKVRLYSVWAIGNILAADKSKRENAREPKIIDQDMIDQLTKLLEFKPGNAAGYLLRGKALTSIGRYYEAVTDFDKAIALSPIYSSEAYVERGWVLTLTNELSRAVSDYDTAISKNSKFGLAYFRRGLAYEKLNRLDEAAEDFSRVIELEPKNAEAYLQRGTVYETQQRAKNAIEDLQMYLSLSPQALDRDSVSQRITSLQFLAP